MPDTGFSHGFGKLEANRELMEWMRRYNADPSHRVKLQFYGFDSPTEMTGSDSPSHVLHFVLDYLALIDSASAQERRERVDPLLGKDSDWENPAGMMDPTKSVGLSPAATALRIEMEELIPELQVRRPELVGKSDRRRRFSSGKLFPKPVHCIPHLWIDEPLVCPTARATQNPDLAFMASVGLQQAKRTGTWLEEKG